ncbi:MAG: ion transporter [Cyanobacteriota bacterium]|nr:ion transporter [Cyanobacteriota bacterium]
MAALSTALLQLAGVLVVALLIRRAVGRRRLAQIIFEADTVAGRNFDLVLLIAIVLSVVMVALESDPRLQSRHQALFDPLELGFALLFSLEYLLRLLCAEQPLRYARSFFGVVDFLSSIPPLAGLAASRSRYLVVIRILRLLRVFRILRLGLYLREASLLRSALIASRRKILVFLLTMITLVVIIGSLMYVIEGEAGGFTSIPVGIYWAIVTITTVGYGDVAPVTLTGRIAASAVMLLGYSIIAVPTGIITAEIRQAARSGPQLPGPGECPVCGETHHLAQARHCHRCGRRLASADQGSSASA